METPLITIIIPTFNRAQFIGETLYSIKNQQYSNWECLIIDDHSTDHTKEVIDEFIRNDRRYHYYLRTSNYIKGAAGSRNYGLDLAQERKAKFIQFFDDDDIMHPEKLKLQIQPFMNTATLNLTICKFDKLVEMNMGERRIEKPEYKLDFPHLGDAILTGALKMNSLSAIWKMDVIGKFRFDERLKCSEEWELFTRIGYNYPQNYAVVDEYLFSYRKHPNSLTMGSDEDYEKRKTSAIIRMILMDYLSEYKLHTKTSLKFFAKSFLIYSYQPKYIQNLLTYMKQENYSKTSIKLLNFSFFLTTIHKRIITKTVNRI